MSGEAGYTLRTELWSVFLGSGINVCVAIPPGGDGSEIGEYFERASEPFRVWLERARPELERIFAAEAERLGLVPLDAEHQEVDGIVIEAPDQKAAHFRHYSRGLPCPVCIDGYGELGLQSLSICIQVASRVRRAELDGLRAKVAEAVRAAKPPAEPTVKAHPVSVTEVPKPRGFWARLRRRFG